MGSVPELLLGTIVLRPYVFVFFIIYLVGCSLHLGMRRAVSFAVVGYLITWLSEYSSIHNGFPYGHYFYIETTRDLELWVLGVPLMDSMSYVFLAYASYSTALMALSPVRRVKGGLLLLETREIKQSFKTTIVAAVLMVCLDVIIDPVALRGSRWFLGQIYGYREPGVYFGVPLPNFAGWFLVGTGLVYSLQKIDDFFGRRGIMDYTGPRLPWRHLIGPGLYCGVILFNLAVTFAIGEYVLGTVDVAVVAMIFSFLFRGFIKRLSEQVPGQIQAELTHIIRKQS